MKAYLTGTMAEIWRPHFFPADESPCIYGDIEYGGPWPDSDRVTQIANADVVFAWFTTDQLGAETAAELGAARASGTPIWTYSPGELTCIPKWINTRQCQANDVPMALEDFHATAPLALDLHRRVLDACRELTDWLRARGPKPEGITRGRIYILRAGEYFKIGKTSDLHRRIRDLKIQLPERADLLHTFYATDMTACEHWLHRIFRDQRSNGEWFRLRGDDLEFIFFLNEWSTGNWRMVSKSNPQGLGPYWEKNYK